MAITLPCQALFFFIIHFISSSGKSSHLDWSVVVFYLFFSYVQLIILLLCCYFTNHVVWRFKQNPDNICIPLLTALADLLGSCLLFLCFHLVYLTGNTSVKYNHDEMANELEFNVTNSTDEMFYSTFYFTPPL